jgi:hypothetical protein
MSMKKHPADSTLDAAWRKAVLESYNWRCGICGLSWLQGSLECHHIIKRRHKLTRWDYRNGVPLCRECHALAHTKAGEAIIARRHPWYDELVTLESINFKDYIATVGWTENEWRQQMLEKLKEKAQEVVEI